jgi:UDP-N-acetylmuramate--alanine ligase
MQLQQTDHVFLSGIGGVSMSGLAHALLDRGYRVSGSDANESQALEKLRAAGARVFTPQSPGNLGDANVFVWTTAITADNPERVAAAERGLRMHHRSELLALMTAGKQGIAVTGTHGKSTTTAMVAHILIQLGADPTVFLGGDHPGLEGGNYRLGAGPHVVFEACESDGSFVQYTGCSQVLTSVEADHLDQHGDLAGVVAAFEAFARVADPAGYLVYNADEALVTRVAGQSPARPISYSLEGPADLCTRDLVTGSDSSAFVLHAAGHEPLPVQMQVGGGHNVRDALAALGCALGSGLDLPAACQALASFTSVGRRFEQVALAGGIRVVDDYAHHPTEIRATLAAARAQHPGRIVALFQPHLRSRTRDLLGEFAGAFEDADIVVLTDVYQPREDGTESFDIADLERRVSAHEPGKRVELIRDKTQLATSVRPWLARGDLVLTLGAGDLNRVARELTELI